jgi:AraC-like DNA-binding protein
MIKSSKPMFWRDDRMPHIELRKVIDGREVCYALHSHDNWSLGAITQGESTYLYRDDKFNIEEGTLVLMNPHWAHACNPIDNKPWAYLMMYIDTDWLSNLRYELGLMDSLCWQDITAATITEPKWYEGYCQMAACLMDSTRELLEKQTVVVEYLSGLMIELSEQAIEPSPKTPANLQALADYMKANAFVDMSLDSLCIRSGYSPGHLIRAFKQHFGFTPHAYLVNYRIQCGQQALKQGRSIVETAVNSGFSDQPHFQRTFKKLLAVTPKQYRQSLLNKQIETTGSQ